MPIHTIKLDNPQALNVVMGQIPFVKTAEEIHAALVVTVPKIKFGIAFNEPGAPPVVKHFGTDETLIELARKSAGNIAVEKTFVLFWAGTFTLNVMNVLRRVPEIQKIYCATTGDVEVIVVDSTHGRGVMGLVGGYAGEDEQRVQVVKRRGGLLRVFGHKY